MNPESKKALKDKINQLTIQQEKIKNLRDNYSQKKDNVEKELRKYDTEIDKLEREKNKIEEDLTT